MTVLRIHPSIGIARVGNSDSFYLAPEEIGGLPLECDDSGNLVQVDDAAQPVSQFKSDGKVRRQAARFRLFAYESEAAEVGSPLEAGAHPEIEKIVWTVHMANKKAAWYTFTEGRGNRLFADNTYIGAPDQDDVPLRNASVQGREKRQKLIIDPGPRSLECLFGKDAPRPSVTAQHLDMPANPADYPQANFPAPPHSPDTIETLGTIKLDASGNLIVLGGYGNASGSSPLTQFTGADGWYDDISDGMVTCEVHYVNPSRHATILTAWVVVAPPKFAPQLQSVVTLDDILFDVAIRGKNLDPNQYDSATKSWKFDYIVDFDRDIRPIMDRCPRYNWVTTMPYMIGCRPIDFDPRDNSDARRPLRTHFLQLFREPAGYRNAGYGQENQFKNDNHAPLLPLGGGDNPAFGLPPPVGTRQRENPLIEKFLTLTPTQYFHLHQWANGKFAVSNREQRRPTSLELDRAGLQTAVGAPMCPGIEVSWSLRNPSIYSAPYRIKPRDRTGARYKIHGLSANEYDETEVVANGEGDGCEPGDLTKRMSSPWHSDFTDCGTQPISFAGDLTTLDPTTQAPPPPTFYSSWWPPQVPEIVLVGRLTPVEERLSGVGMGNSVSFSRGINSISDMIIAWSYLGFITNQVSGPAKDVFPFFGEVERNHAQFVVTNIAAGGDTNLFNPTDTSFSPMWFLKSDETTEQKRAATVRRHRRRRGQ